MVSLFRRDLFEQHRPVLEAYARKVLSSRKTDDKKRRIFTVVCEASGAELAVVIERSGVALVVTRHYRGQGIKAVEPLTTDDAQEFPLARNNGVQFRPLPASELWRRINNGDAKWVLKNRADYDILGYRVRHPNDFAEAKTRHEDLLRSLRALRQDATFPAREELIAHTERELAVAQRQLAEARGNTPDDRADRQ